MRNSMVAVAIGRTATDRMWSGCRRSSARRGRPAFGTLAGFDGLAGAPARGGGRGGVPPGRPRGGRGVGAGPARAARRGGGPLGAAPPPRAGPPAPRARAGFDGLLGGARARGRRVLVAFVPNHASDRRGWLAESRPSRVSRRRDWYVWADPASAGGPPNNWLSTFPATGSAWTLDEPTGQYYLHSYTTAQPDLNWHNAEGRAAMAGVLRLWLDRGGDGFRIDAAHRPIKDPALAGNPAHIAGARTALAPGAQRLRHIDQPGVHTLLRELRAAVAGYGGDRLLLGQVGAAPPARCGPPSSPDGHPMLPLDSGSWDPRP